MKELCPCCSGKIYSECCQPYHQGSLPANALALMRSRYSAYSLHLASYIIHTTHPDNPNYMHDPQKWEKQILAFTHLTIFEKLKIHSFKEEQEEAFVTFTASLKQGGKDASFTETSRFLKVNEKWLYRDGKMNQK